MSRINLLLAGLLLLASLPAGLNAQDAPPDAKAMIKDALSATTAEMAKGATVVDWENNVLREGDNGWTCFPSPPQTNTGPMCVDEPWLTWAAAWMNKKEVNITRLGISYMLAGDRGASNSDPYATEETDDWFVTGPHLMIIVPDASMLEGIPTDPENGGPWVMWKGTPYVHVMVPIKD
ncbi:MAG TPA: hypothetical protein VNA25_29930 [Phycisphaerae bacterium]|jgi:hypothetical protein|nr:hypothetical protein [Phycisphaerae bacterium]